MARLNALDLLCRRVLIGKRHSCYWTASTEFVTSGVAQQSSLGVLGALTISKNFVWNAPMSAL